MQRKKAELPSPPAHPQRSPKVHIPGETSLLIEGIPLLDACVFGSRNAKRAVLICHPHPLYGGSMHSPVPLSIARRLAEAGGEVAYLRFSFRGVPESQGVYDDGRGEVGDALRALDHLRAYAPSAKLSVCGHSFGSWVGLRAADRASHVDRVALVGPSTRFFEFSTEPRDSVAYAIFLGDQDEFCDPEEGRSLAEKLGASFSLLEGMDHHFLKSRRIMAEAVAAWVASPVLGSSPSQSVP